VTPQEIVTAREVLGDAWGLKRPLKRAELGRAVGLTSRTPGRAVRDWEDLRFSPPESVCDRIRDLLEGALPEGGVDAVVLSRDHSKRMHAAKREAYRQRYGH
jgi:hypothetical protein